jgi:ribbon-helix-helix CopG family protein
MPADKVVVSFRLSTDEYRALAQAAEGADESVSEFVRRAVTLRLGGGIPIRIMPNTSFVAPFTRLEVNTPTLTSSAPSTLVQDEYLVQAN